MAFDAVDNAEWQRRQGIRREIQRVLKEEARTVRVSAVNLDARAEAIRREQPAEVLGVVGGKGCAFVLPAVPESSHPARVPPMPPAPPTVAVGQRKAGVR